MPRSVLEQSGYLSSFPDMIGTVSTFTGDNAAHKRLMEAAQSGGDWTAMLEAADVSLCPAVCHPLYPTLGGTLPEGGSRYDVSGWCFRHEPSLDPARMQSFRQHDLVYVGDADAASQHRDRWLQLGAEILTSFGLVVEKVVANDPFFGRVGRILAENQRAETLKFEIVTPVNSVEHPTAIASANCHLDHFGEPFGIVTADGAVAHSCCFGFGLDRITLALLRTHGVRAGGLAEGGTGPALAVSAGSRSQLLDVDRASYRPHPLHAGERTWTETNCYVDLWIELLHALGLDPLAAAAFTLSTDFEGDQWTFFKFPPEDLRALFGLEVAEFNVWRPTLDHAEEQLELGRLFIMDADAWFLPDTQGVSYRIAPCEERNGPQHDRQGRAPSGLLPQCRLLRARGRRLRRRVPTGYLRRPDRAAALRRDRSPRPLAPRPGYGRRRSGRADHGTSRSTARRQSDVASGATPGERRGVAAQQGH